MTQGRKLPTNRRVGPPKEHRGRVVQAPAEAGLLDDSAEASRRNRFVEASMLAVDGAVAGVRRQSARIRSVLGILFVVAASVAVAWAIRHHVLTSPRFAVKTIRVEGTFKRTPEEVSATAGIEAGLNIFSLDFDNARTRLLQDPWLRDARVERRLPSTVSIQVTEREGAAAVAVGSELYVCAQDGELFKRLEPGDLPKMVVITGITPEQVASDRKAVMEQIATALDLLGLYAQKGPSKSHPAQEVNIAPDGGMRMFVGKEAVTVELGKPPYRKKLLRAARVMSEAARRRAEPAVVYLDNEAHPERVVVRMR